MSERDAVAAETLAVSAQALSPSVLVRATLAVPSATTCRRLAHAWTASSFGNLKAVP